MTKIVRAVNSMISHAEKISDVSIFNNEYFFKFDNKYVWGIFEKEEDYILSYYPETGEVDDLGGEWQDIPMVIYNTKDLKTQESLESFGELYLIIKEKLYDVGKALDDIIDMSEHQS